jgi:hypothetical protein
LRSAGSACALGWPAIELRPALGEVTWNAMSPSISTAVEGEPALNVLGVLQVVRRLRLPERHDRLGVDAVDVAGLGLKPRA